MLEEKDRTRDIVHVVVLVFAFFFSYPFYGILFANCFVCCSHDCVDSSDIILSCSSFLSLEFKYCFKTNRNSAAGMQI